MSDDQTNKRPHSGYNPSAKVELAASPVGAEKTKKQVNWKMAGILGGVIVLLVIIGVVSAIMIKNPEKLQTSKGSNILGDLPFGGDQATSTPEISGTVSGLSGVTCEHANRRPIGVMVAGDPINRPISGFSKADMVWELPVLVSNVTRLMTVYQCGEPTEIGSVRSARHNYLFLIEGLDGIIAHWGGSYHALNRVAAGEFQTLNALVNPNNAFFRKSNLPAPYNGFTNYSNLWDTLQKLGYRTTTNFAGYNFKDDAAASDRPAGGTLTIAWPGAFRVSWEYDAATNRYVRYWAGVKQVDPENNQVVAPSTVVIMNAYNKSMEGPGGYNDVGMEGTGKLAVYQDGKVITGTWTKNALNKKDPVHFLNDQGQPIVFTRGQVWVMTPADDIGVTWEPKSEVVPAVTTNATN